MTSTDTKQRYSLISLGCARSLVDSEQMVNALNQSGYTVVPEGSDEAIVILNTCSFIQSAIEETKENIRALVAKKQRREIQYIVVVGCYVSRFAKEELALSFPEVDLWLSTFEEDRLVEQLNEAVFQKRFLPDAQAKPYTKLTPSHYTYLKISEGCNNWCSFCTIPKIRGQHVSRSIEDIVADIDRHVAMGAKEFVIIAEDTTCWGEDIYGEPSLHLLIEAIGKTKAQWVRLMYIYPSRVNDDLIRVIRDTPNVIPYIDMPIQHVSSDILKSMQRRHDKDFLLDVFEKFHKEIPNFALRTTFILGFPGESDAHVKEIQDFITEIPFAQVGCFAFSYEEGTRSARLPDQVPADLAQERIAAVMQSQKESLAKQVESMIDTEILVIYDGHGIARGMHQAPEVDTVTFIDKPDGLVAGEIYTARITGSRDYDLVAEVLK